ncbi:MAG: MATE family efflux transporter [Chitinispirillaceae bacterium]|nr:MATE family efflux transporter [Chitinispirillaceae bacterium]
MQNTSPATTAKHELSIFKLTWPIWIENMLRVALSSADVFMLSFYSEKAVAAVGLINQFVFFIQILFLMIVFGSSILISQHLGARKKEEAAVFALGSISLCVIFAIVLTAVVCSQAGNILHFYTLEADVHRYAFQFLTIYSAGSVFTALSMILGTILRAHGYSKVPMIISVIANILNVTGNYCALFSPFGLPVTGVVGVAVSTVFSQFASFVILAVIVWKHHDIHIPFRKVFSIPWTVYKKILSIGVPTAGENLSYNIGQIVIMKIIASLGTDAMTASVYTLTILRFVFISSISIGNGTQIKVGHLVGAKKYNEAHRKVFRYFYVGALISLVLVVAVFFAREPIIHIFTKNDSVFQLISTLLLIAMIHEPGRNFNIIIIPALKGAGDIKFPVLAGMIFMWGIGVLFSWILGIKFGLGLAGIWIALTSDEWIRGLVMYGRWKNGKWRSKSLVTEVSV